MGWMRFTWLAYGAKPVEDRKVFRAVKRAKVGSVLEIGIGSIDRAEDLVSACRRCSSSETIRYAAVDWFEERPEGMPELSFITAHRALGATGAKVRLSPGGPAAVEAIANSLPNLDLVLISADISDAELGRGWYFIPRMCHAETVVLRGVAGPQGERDYQLLDVQELAGRAEAVARPLAA